MRYKAIIWPGHVYSAFDGDKHYIDAPTLARLYGVNLKGCYVVREFDYNAYSPDMEGLPILEPKYSGDYNIANCRKFGIGHGVVEPDGKESK